MTAPAELLALHALPAAPPQLLNAQGQPIFGRFSGELMQIDWHGLAAPWQRSAWWRRFHHKRWRYIALATKEIFCGIAIVDLGWVSSSFAYVFERASGRELYAFSQDGLPGLCARISAAPTAGADCRFAFAGKQISFRHLAEDNCYQLQVRAKGLTIDATLDVAGAAPALLAVGEIKGGSVHATQKSGGMHLHGAVCCVGRRFDLQDGVGSFDYSNGMLERDTAWRWASAHDMQLGFNLQHGYFAAQENALWLDGKIYPLGAAHFQYDAAQPEAPWQIWTEDGLLQLEFVPEGARRQNKNLGVAISRYVQPVGRFSGWVKPYAGSAARPVSNLVGVTEDHFSRW